MAILAGVAGVTKHFSRFKVTEIALLQRAVGQFGHGELVIRTQSHVRNAILKRSARRGQPVALNCWGSPRRAEPLDRWASTATLKWP
jgi:hypothetical protein